MRLVRCGWLALLLLVPFQTGCLGRTSSSAQFLQRLPFLNAADPTAESAFIEYVMIDRPAGRADINRDLWERVDEQMMLADVRLGLEGNGLRVGTISESMPGVLRSMADDPRTSRGHRFRSFAAEKSALLFLTPESKPVDFTMPNGDREPLRFKQETAALGFEISVKELPDHKIQVRLMPLARYYDPTQFVPTKAEGLRDQSLEPFANGSFEVVLSGSEYLVIGTDFYARNTFGHAAFINNSDTLERSAQRVLVLRAGLSKAERSAPKLLNGKDDATGPLPIASQASLARGQKP